MEDNMALSGRPVQLQKKPKTLRVTTQQDNKFNMIHFDKGSKNRDIKQQMGKTTKQYLCLNIKSHELQLTHKPRLISQLSTYKDSENTS